MGVKSAHRDIRREPIAYECVSLECYAHEGLFADNWEDESTPEEIETVVKQGGLPCISIGTAKQPDMYCQNCYWFALDEC